MFTLPMESVGMAMATYTGQNYGAGRIDRIRAGIRWGLLLQYIYCAAAWLVIFLLKAPLTALVLGAVYCLGMTCWILNKSKEFSI